MGAALRLDDGVELLPVATRSSRASARSRSHVSDVPNLRLVAGNPATGIVGSAVRNNTELQQLGAISATVPVFDALEQMAILIGRNDPRFAISAKSAVGRSLAFLFGINAQNPLADPKLEALRRFAWSLRRRTRRTSAAVDAALAAGVARSKVDHLLSQA